MARNHFTVVTPVEVPLLAGQAKTVVQVIAPADQIVAVQGVRLTCDGTDGTAEPVRVDLVRQTTTGTMTAQTPKKTKDTATALRTTGAVNATVEPAAGDLLRSYHVHPQAGVIDLAPLPDGEVEIPGGGRLGVVVTAPAAVNCLVTVEGEE